MAQDLRHAVARHPVRMALGVAINLLGFWALISHG